MTPAAARVADTVQRLSLRIRGQVQGVGFRPYVYRLAQELGLSGWVRNDGEGVLLEVQGSGAALDTLTRRLSAELPPLARVDSLDAAPRPIEAGATGFTIVASAGGPVSTGIAADAAVCDACLAELFDRDDRRYRFPFINCTHCGPRFTITRALPYDRPNTAMGPFSLCAPCAKEYADPADRRFHAQPDACGHCGPRLALHDGTGAEIAVPDPIAATLRQLRAGRIVAIKGLGGFHLVCDARNGAAVAELRARKAREEKPFALMAANALSIEPYVHLGAAEGAQLASAQRPVVLLRKKGRGAQAFAGCAPDNGWLGVMLPYTPLHYLLFHEAAGRPDGCDWLAEPQELVLVMTSANPGGEPLVIDNQEAFTRLAGIADAFLVHDRDIVVRCDDSVLRVQGHGPVFLRRARGYTPQAIRLARGGPSLLALGGWFKNTVCVTRGEEAFVSQHVGDLDNVASCGFFEETVAHLTQVLAVAPQALAHDAHPDFFNSRFAAALSAERGIPAIPVFHHHAHVAAIAAEHGLDGPLLGLALDGVGLGPDGEAWGGELLRFDAVDFQRIGHLAALPLPGGDRAAREPWRMAAAALHRLGQGDRIVQRFPGEAGAAVAEMLARAVNCPSTTSAGRWFDAAAGLLGVSRRMSFEGQAAMRLEGLAERYGPVEPPADAFTFHDGTLDLLPLLAMLAECSDPARGAALFHATLVDALAQWCLAAAQATGLSRIALGGGCFLNHLLSEGLSTRLADAGLTVYRAARVPPNDGGLALGQAWVALNRLQDGLLQGAPVHQ